MKCFKLLSLLLLAAITITACTKEGAGTNAGQFTYQSNTYETNNATFVVFGDSAVLGFTKSLSSEINTGVSVSFNLNGLAKAVPVGTYTYALYNSPNYDKTKNFFQSFVAVEYNRVAATGAAIFGLKTGTITIAKTDTKYQVSYQITLPDDKVVSGTYAGGITTVIQR